MTLLAAHNMDAKELFMNGEFVPAAHGMISVRTHGFAYGTGCFEGIRGYWNEAEQQGLPVPPARTLRAAVGFPARFCKYRSLTRLTN